MAGFYDDLLKFIALTTDQGFTQQRFNQALISAEHIEEILAAFNHYQAPMPKWGANDQQGLIKPV